MAAISLFWYTNMAAVTSDENDLLRLILRIITHLTYICWEIDNFVIKSDIFRRFFICKNILKKLSCYHRVETYVSTLWCYHDNYFRYFMFGKYNGFVSKARVSACMYFLVSSGSYISRLQTLHLLPICYWHEYLDMVLFFKRNSCPYELVFGLHTTKISCTRYLLTRSQ
jgi:hypothetical protein